MDLRRWKTVGLALYLFVLGVFLIGSPGRIDIIDGQYRFEVSKNILNMSGADLKDYYLIQGGIPVNAKTGRSYSFYTSVPSLVPLPFMFVSRIVSGPRIAADRGAFVLSNAFMGALIAPLLLGFYRRLGVPLRRAVFWTLGFCLATHWWPGSETVFDQCQHGVCLLALLLVSFDTVVTRLISLALGAGLLGGILFNYRTPFVTLLPIVPVYWWFVLKAEGVSVADRRAMVLKMGALFGVGIGVGLAGYLFYNYIRFDSISMPAYSNPQSIVGNPISGIPTILISPGKGGFWFSPPIILSLFGLKFFPSSFRTLKLAIIALVCLHVFEMSCLSFVAGDWCWGPRYLLPILPLMGLALPFIPFRIRSLPVVALLSIGILVQLMGISTETYRFFYNQQFNPFFWQDQWVYFRVSQLASRPGEIIESIRTRDVQRPLIICNPPGEATYAPFDAARDANKKRKPKRPNLKHKGPTPTGWANLLQMADAKYQENVKKTTDQDIRPREFQKRFKLFYLPRPWWGWINAVPPEQRPFDPRLIGTFSLLVCALGSGMLLFLLRQIKSTTKNSKENSDLNGD